MIGWVDPRQFRFRPKVEESEREPTFAQMCDWVARDGPVPALELARQIKYMTADERKQALEYAEREDKP